MKRTSASGSRATCGILRRTWNALAHTAKAIAEGASEARRMQRMYDELSSMSDLELHDFGLIRSDIPAVVTGTYRPPRPPSNVLPIGRREHASGRATEQHDRGSERPPETRAKTVDLRNLMPAQRHAEIFQRVNELGPASSFILVDDRDPGPLCDRLAAKYPKQLLCTYLERGPEAWRVEIGRQAKAA